MLDSGAGTNLKAGNGGTRPTQSTGRMLLSCPYTFRLRSHFGEHFCDGQYSLVSFLFAVLLLTVHPRAQLFVKLEPRAPRVQ